VKNVDVNGLLETKGEPMATITTTSMHGFAVGDTIYLDPFTCFQMNIFKKIWLRIKYFFIGKPRYTITSVTNTSFTIEDTP
jgi:hypothetical protein